MMKPKVAFFDFTGCEGCQLDALDLSPEDIQALVEAVDIVNFREVMTEQSDEYDIAFVEGSISRDAEISRLQKIREQASILVALGSCACIGGINCLKNHLPMNEALRIVYGNNATYYDTIPARPIDAIVPVEYYVRGCPAQSEELLKVIKAILLNKKPEIPGFPVCVDCKMAGNICVFDRGMTCLGPVIRAGCGAICISAGSFCWGCRGLVDEPNINSEKEILSRYGLNSDEIVEKFKICNSYAEVT